MKIHAANEFQYSFLKYSQSSRHTKYVEWKLIKIFTYKTISNEIVCGLLSILNT